MNELWDSGAAFLKEALQDEQTAETAFFFHKRGHFFDEIYGIWLMGEQWLFDHILILKREETFKSVECF